MPGVSLAGTWEIQTLSMVVQVFGAVTSLTVRAFIADVEALSVERFSKMFGRFRPSHLSQISVGSASRHLFRSLESRHLTQMS